MGTPIYVKNKLCRKWLSGLNAGEIVENRVGKTCYMPQRNSANVGLISHPTKI